MNYKKLFGFGALIWVVAYIVATGFVAYGKSHSITAGVVVVIAVAIAAFLAGRNLGLGARKEIIKYSAGWVIIGLILDAIFTVPFTGWALFKTWDIWLGYLLILSAPLLAIKK